MPATVNTRNVLVATLKGRTGDAHVEGLLLLPRPLHRLVPSGDNSINYNNFFEILAA